MSEEFVDFESTIAVLSPSEEEREIISWLYNEVGDRVSERLQSSDSDTEPYDVVGESVDEVLEEFESSDDYDVIKRFVSGQFDELVAVLKYGYGSPEEIFADYREIIG